MPFGLVFWILFELCANSSDGLDNLDISKVYSSCELDMTSINVFSSENTKRVKLNCLKLINFLNRTAILTINENEKVFNEECLFDLNFDLGKLDESFRQQLSQLLQNYIESSFEFKYTLDTSRILKILEYLKDNMLKLKIIENIGGELLTNFQVKTYKRLIIEELFKISKYIINPSEYFKCPKRQGMWIYFMQISRGIISDFSFLKEFSGDFKYWKLARLTGLNLNDKEKIPSNEIMMIITHVLIRYNQIDYTHSDDESNNNSGTTVEIMNGGIVIVDEILKLLDINEVDNIQSLIYLLESIMNNYNSKIESNDENNIDKRNLKNIEQTYFKYKLYYNLKSLEEENDYLTNHDERCDEICDRKYFDILSKIHEKIRKELQLMLESDTNSLINKIRLCSLINEESNKFQSSHRVSCAEEYQQIFKNDKISNVDSSLDNKKNDLADMEVLKSSKTLTIFNATSGKGLIDEKTYKSLKSIRERRLQANLQSNEDLENTSREIENNYIDPVFIGAIVFGSLIVFISIVFIIRYIFKKNEDERGSYEL